MLCRWQFVWSGVLLCGVVGCSGSSGSSGTPTAQAPAANSAPSGPAAGPAAGPAGGSATPGGMPALGNPAAGGSLIPGGASPMPGAGGMMLPPPSNTGSMAPTGVGALGAGGLIPGAPPPIGATGGSMLPPPGTNGATGAATAGVGAGLLPPPGGAGMAGAGAMPGMPGMMGGQAAQQPPKNLMEFAQRSFKQGKDKEGFDYLMAHYLCNEKGRGEIQDVLKWSGDLRRPTLGVRYGFAVAYAPPKDFKSDPQPIGRVIAVKKEPKNKGGQPGGSPPGMPASPGMAMGGMMGGGNAAGPDEKDGLKSLEWYTGDLGKKMFEELKTKIDTGDFGSALRGLEGPNSKPAAANAGGMPGMAGMPGMSAGIGMPGMPGGAPAAAAGEIKPGDPRGMSPGIVWLGQALSKESLEKKAKDQAIDVLLMYEVTVTVAKNGIVRNSTKLRVSLVEKEKDIIVTPLLANHKMHEEREKNKEKDPVDTEVQKVLAALEKGLKVGDLPEAVTAEAATARIKKLAGSSENRLRTLLEAQLFFSKNLLKVEDLKESFVSMGIKDLDKLITGTTEEERAVALAELLPEKEEKKM